MGSPFICEEPVEPPDLLADRTEELALLGAVRLRRATVGSSERAT
jgi:hypothetical protein